MIQNINKLFMIYLVILKKVKWLIFQILVDVKVLLAKLEVFN